MECRVALIRIFQENKILISSIFIFILTVLVLGIPYTKWGFVADDFGGIFHAKDCNLQDAVKLFYEGSEDGPDITGPSMLDESCYSPTFELTLYRPLSYILTILQTKVFGVWAYCYLLFMIFLHALNAVILFRLFLAFFSLDIAFWGSLFFAFHSSLYRWMGIVGCQKYPIGLTLLLISVWALKKYLIDLYSLKYYLLSCFIVFISLFFMEHLLVMPVWVFIAVLFYGNSFIRALKISSGFILSTIFYLALRFALFPIASAIKQSPLRDTIFKFLERQSGRFFDYLSYLVGLINLNWLSGGHRLLKGFLILLVFIVLSFPYFYKKRLKLFIFLIFSVILLSWPVFWLTYMPRYFYIAIPFFVLIVLFSVKFYLVNFTRFNYLIYGFLYSLLIFNMFFLIAGQREKECKLNTIVTAFKTLVKKERNNRSLCFVGLPNNYFGSCNRQAVYLYADDSSFPVYYDRSNFICINPEKNKKTLEVLPVDNGFRFKSLYPDNGWFCCRNSGDSSLGEVIINNSNELGLPTDITYIFRSKLLDQNPIFITWDYKNKKFIFLGY